jgi:putative tryptophan/tyrosine transport system substrate-binding protein
VADIKRRDFITLVGGAAAAWPLAARAQQPTKLPTIGFLGSSTPSLASQLVAAFVQRLHELGWSEERTVVIEYRWTEGRPERAAASAAEFVNLKVDILVSGGGTPTAMALKAATTSVPIVFVNVADPVDSKLVVNLARPGGNVTGLSNQQTDVIGKRIEILHEVIPDLRRLALLGSVGNPAAQLDKREAAAAAEKLGLEFVAPEFRRAEDLVPVFEAIKGRVDALLVTGEPLTGTNRVRIITLALAARLPTMYAFRPYVVSGGLMSYGANQEDEYRRAAEYVDKILHGTKPGDIPIEQPTKFELVINLTSAYALGLTIPGTLRARADELVE